MVVAQVDNRSVLDCAFLKKIIIFKEPAPIKGAGFFIFTDFK